MDKSKVEDSNLTVVLRIRPMSREEILKHATPVAQCVDQNIVILMDPMDDCDGVFRQNSRSREKQFIFDVALDGEANQEYVYEKTCKCLIPSVVSGYNATVFAYGATGAGKTYTMLGADDNPGIMAQALTELFTEMKRRDDLIFSVTMSYLEIYNEMIRDLLNPRIGFLDLREDHNGIQVVGLTEHSARNTDQVMAMLKNGNRQRTQEPTAANQTSSRSHAVLIISIHQKNHVQGLHQQLRIGKLYLIDLAGSERAANTKNRGKRMVEGAHINRSLLALGNCINALSDKSGQKYVNYRDSKLTRLLKDSLGGNCKTVMIAHVSPASCHFEESRNTLIYADRAKQIRTKVHQNVVDMKAHISQHSVIIKELQDEIKRLRMKLRQQNGQKNFNIPLQDNGNVHNDYDPELAKLKQDLVSVFHDQIEMRHSLTELNATEAGICLKMTRLQVLIKRHKLEHDPLLPVVRNGDNESSVDRDAREPFDVDAAVREVSSLSRDKQRLENLRDRLVKQLEMAKDKTARLHEEISSLEICAEQREIVDLLAKIQSLQMENARLNSAIVNQRAILSRCDLFVSMQDRCQDVSKELVKCQHEVINDSDVNQPHLMDYLQNAYRQELHEVESLRNQLLPEIKKNQRLLSRSGSLAAIESSSYGNNTPSSSVVNDVRHRNDTPYAASSLGNKASLTKNDDQGPFATNYAKHGIRKEVEDVDSLSSEISTMTSSVPEIDFNGNKQVNGHETGRGQRSKAAEVSLFDRNKVTTRGTSLLSKRSQVRGNGTRDRQKLNRDKGRTPLTVSRLAHHNRRYAEANDTPAAHASLTARIEKKKRAEGDLLPQLPTNSLFHRPNQKVNSKLNATVQSSPRILNKRLSMPMINDSNHRKLLQQPSYVDESDTSVAPSVVSERAAILNRLNHNNSYLGSTVAIGDDNIRDSVYTSHSKKGAITPSLRKSYIPVPSFALHH